MVTRSSATAEIARVGGRYADLVSGIYPAVALVVDGVSATVELDVEAVAIRVEAADVVTSSVAVRRRPVRITRALLKVACCAAVAWYVVVAATVHEVTIMNRAARGRVVNRQRVRFITFAVDEVLAVC